MDFAERLDLSATLCRERHDIRIIRHVNARDGAAAARDVKMRLGAVVKGGFYAVVAEGVGALVGAVVGVAGAIQSSKRLSLSKLSRA